MTQLPEEDNDCGNQIRDAVIYGELPKKKYKEHQNLCKPHEHTLFFYEEEELERCKSQSHYKLRH